MLRVGGATGLPGHILPESPPSRAAPRRPTGRGAAAGRCCGSPSAPPGRPAPGLVADKSQRHRPDTTLGANWTRPPAQWPRHGNRPAVLALNWVEGHRKRRTSLTGQLAEASRHHLGAEAVKEDVQRVTMETTLRVRLVWKRAVQGLRVRAAGTDERHRTAGYQPTNQDEPRGQQGAGLTRAACREGSSPPAFGGAGRS